MKRRKRSAGVALWGLVTVLAGSLGADDGTKAGRVDFAREILPVLSEKCFVCHGPDGQDSDIVRLDSYEEATRDLGGYRAIDPEDLRASEVLARIHSQDAPMPPEDADKQLSKRERTLLTRWIEQGGEYAAHWSFVPPVKQLPAGSENAAKDEVIDAFVGARLRQAGVDLAPAADRATLARRASLVLTGLPPGPSRLKRFLADQRSDAYRHYVEELLASPRFGEHQGRYWLDAIRYGDTHGLHLDNRRAIYPYRNWVIHALNENLPLDRFITWQLAGDLLPDPTLEQQVATGFVRMNPTTSEGGVIPAEFQAKNNFDRVETLGTVLLGMSLTCARCHTHKYDPIPQTEYYRLLAFFNSTSEAPLDGNKYEYGPTVAAPADVAAWREWDQLARARRELLGEACRTGGVGHGAEGAMPEGWEEADAATRLAMVADPQGAFWGLELRRRAERLAGRFAELESGFATTLVARELEQPRDTRLLQRGEYDLPLGDPLEPGTLSVLGEFPDGAPRNRLGLAHWLTSPDNPLVARVLVNRIWQRTFGEGLVRTPEDFGVQGEQPTHPALLDWLAVELQESGWDLKHMLRLMVHSRAFRQQSAWRSDLDDPENRLLGRGPRFRLDAEVIRDMGLWSSGLLEPFMGGEGTKPYQPSGMWAALMHPASNTKKYERDQGDRLYRRSVYMYWKRTCPHPMLTLLDAPSRETSCVRRSRTNTPLQSLALFNETQRIEMGRVLAGRLLRERDNDDERLELLFILLGSRSPSQRERVACGELLAQMRQRYASAPDDAQQLLSIGDAPRDETLARNDHAAWTQVAVTVLASDVAIMLY